MFAAEWGTGQVLWSMTWFFLFAMWIMLIISVLADVLRARNLSGFTKALWMLAIITLPFLGIFMYLIVNGNRMNDRADVAVHEQERAIQENIRQATTSSRADQLATLAELHNAGKLSDGEFAAAKAAVTAS